MSRHLFRAALAAAILLSTAPLPAGAQTTTTQAATKDIAGRIVDTTGLAIPGATVALLNTATGLERLETTDANGDYRFVGLADSAYRLSVSIDGFAPASRDAKSGTANDIELRPAQVVESVTVVSGARQARDFARVSRHR